MATRINARLDDALAERVEAVRRKTGETVTQVVEAALEAYCESHEGEARSTAEIFEETGFIGSGKGPRDLARNAKRYLTESLARKHGHR